MNVIYINTVADRRFPIQFVHTYGYTIYIAWSSDLLYSVHCPKSNKNFRDLT